MVRHGVEYANRELLQEQVAGLGYLKSAQARRAVESALERKVTGKESDEDVEDLVDEVLEREL